jgi:hypothetical protein
VLVVLDQIVVAHQAVVVHLYRLQFVYRPEPAAESVIFWNNFHNTGCKGADDIHCSAYAQFNEVLEALLDRGLAIEKVDAPVTLGPGLSESASRDPKSLKELDAQGLNVVRIDAKDCVDRTSNCPLGEAGLDKADQARLKEDGHFFRIQKDHSKYQFYFEKRETHAVIAGEAETLAQKIRDGEIKVADVCQDRKTKEELRSDGTRDSAIGHLPRRGDFLLVPSSKKDEKQGQGSLEFGGLSAGRGPGGRS